MSSVEEVRADPLARQEAVEAANDLPEEHLVRFIDACRQEAEDSTAHERNRWRELFDLWEGVRDFKDKEAWQSQIVIEKGFTIVEQAVAQVQRALLDSPNFLAATGQARDKLMSVAIWESYLRAALDIVHFVPKYADALQVAFICGMSNYLKLRWRPYSVVAPSGQAEVVSFLNIESIPPWKIFRDPDSKPREQWSGTYIIHRDWVDINRLIGSKVFVNIDKIKASKPGPRMGSGTEITDAERRREWNRHAFRRAVEVEEFWGDILDENGEIVLPDALMAKVDRTLIRRPGTNPIWSVDPSTGRRRWPFIGFSPFTHPVRFEGRGLLQQVELLVWWMENILNLGSDGLNWLVNRGIQADLNRLANPLDTQQAPGKVWALKPGAAGRAIEDVPAGQIDVGSWLAVLQYSDQLIQNNSFVTDFVIGLPGSRAEITKGEVEIKTAQSLAIFDRMGRNVELGGRQLAELAYDMLVQFTDETAVPVIGSLIPVEAVLALALATPEQRWNQLRADMQITFSGVTQALQRTELLQRLLQVSAIAQQPFYQGMVRNPADILRTIVELLGLRDRIEISDAPPVPPGLAVPPELAGQPEFVEQPGQPVQAPTAPEAIRPARLLREGTVNA